ncbi:hypothetical protein Droror1_Dr00009748 [Drosera rotundifolia]
MHGSPTGPGRSFSENDLGSIEQEDDYFEDSTYKKLKRTDQQVYEKWKSSGLESNNSEKVEKVANKRTKQARLNFPKADLDTKRTEIKADFLFPRHPSNIFHALSSFLPKE